MGVSHDRQACVDSMYGKIFIVPFLISEVRHPALIGFRGGGGVRVMNNLLNITETVASWQLSPLYGTLVPGSHSNLIALYSAFPSRFCLTAMEENWEEIPWEDFARWGSVDMRHWKLQSLCVFSWLASCLDIASSWLPSSRTKKYMWIAAQYICCTLCITLIVRQWNHEIQNFLFKVRNALLMCIFTKPVLLYHWTYMQMDYSPVYDIYRKYAYN